MKMGRTVRMIPPDWEHPKDSRGEYIPLLEETPNQYAEDKAQWEKGFVRTYKTEGDRYEPKSDSYKDMPYIDYAGELGTENRMPDFEAGTATHLCMYEDTSEGTPLSPAFGTPEELARWLADNNASAFGSQGASYESWLATIKGGYAPSMVVSSDKGLQSGVDFVAEHSEDETE